MPRDQSPFTAEVLHLDGTAVLLLGGELDIATAPILRRALDDIVSPHLRAVTLDLRDLTFVDVAGLRGLIAAKRAVTAVGARFRLLSVSDLTRQVIRIVGFDELEEATEPV
jgi:anti-sigma B factor antagonist